MKIFIIFLFILFIFSLPQAALASSTAKSVVETQIEGEGEVYQSVETTVNGQTVKKESREPGTLELEMKQEGNSEPTVSFSQTTNDNPSPTLTPTSPIQIERLTSLASQITDFVRKLLDSLMLRFTQHQP